MRTGNEFRIGFISLSYHSCIKNHLSTIGVPSALLSNTLLGDASNLLETAIVRGIPTTRNVGRANPPYYQRAGGHPRTLLATPPVRSVRNERLQSLQGVLLFFAVDQLENPFNSGAERVR